MINDDTLYEAGQLANVDLASLEATFDDLPADPYAPAGLRSRRYSRYRVAADGAVTHLPHQDFMQSKDINKAVGDVQRRFEEIEPQVEKDPAFVAMVGAFRRTAGLEGEGIVEVHQVRWNCDKKVMLPAPEGTHQDGFDRIGMFMVDSENHTGGEVLVYRSLDEAPVLKKTLTPGGYVVLNDKRVFHDAAPLIPEPNPEPGHWDFIVMTANKEA